MGYYLGVTLKFLERIMKYLLLVVMSLSTLAFAKDKIDAEVIKVKADRTDIELRILCIDGHKFLNTDRRIGSNVMQNSTIQMFEEKNGVSVPSTCE
jgi:hypothetical protein